MTAHEPQDLAVDSDAWRQRVTDGARQLGIGVTAEQVQAMSTHARELLQWNRISNLTAITDPRMVAIKHYVDALAAIELIPRGATVLDAGTGGGFPGLPVKIVRPELSVTLMDSVRKKISFLNYVIGTLNLKGIHAVHGRLEDLAVQPEYRGQFDVVICRAFSALEDFAALCLPFLSEGGSLLAMKGPQAEADHEMGAVAGDETLVVAGTRCRIYIQRYTLPILGDQRRLVKLTPR